MNNDKEYYDNYKNSAGLIHGIIIPGILLGGALFGYGLSFNIFNGGLGEGISVEDPQPVALVLMAIATFLLIITSILLFTVNRSVIKRRYVINQEKIETFYRNEAESATPFSDISQLYKYRFGPHAEMYGMTTCLAYRKDNASPWIPVVRKLKGKGSKQNGRELTTHIEQRFLETHLEKNIEILESGGFVEFPFIYFDNQNQQLKFEKNMMKLARVDTSDNKVNQHISSHFENYSGVIRLFRDRIEVPINNGSMDNETITFDATDILKIIPINIGLTISRKGNKLLGSEIANTISIKDQSNNIKISFETTQIINSALLEELLKRKLQ